jgi:acetyl-CoA decarbonylase/synthase complex subunit delta
MPYLLDKSAGSINEVVLGATKADGGTRGTVLKIGGESALPFQNYEGDNPNPAVVAVEISDVFPKDWPQPLKDAWGEETLASPAAWAKKAVENGADMIYIKLLGLDPDNGGHSIDECVNTVRSVLEAVSCPIGVQGCGIDDLDKPLIAKISEEFQGENLLIGLAKQENYATYVAASMANGHTLIASSPLDINICKQINILISDMNMPLNRLVIDPSVGGLGYGLEYAYSVMERGRIGALQGDRMLAMPVIGFVGQEAWKAKEANASEEDFAQWGNLETRGKLWETVTATSFLQAGIDILVLRHPKTIGIVKKQIQGLMTQVAAK